MMWPGNGPGGCNTLIDVCIFIRKREIILVQTKMKTLSALCCLLKFVLGVFCVARRACSIRRGPVLRRSIVRTEW